MLRLPSLSLLQVAGTYSSPVPPPHSSCFCPDTKLIISLASHAPTLLLPASTFFTSGNRCGRHWGVWEVEEMWFRFLPMNAPSGQATKTLRWELNPWAICACVTSTHWVISVFSLWESNNDFQRVINLSSRATGRGKIHTSFTKRSQARSDIAWYWGEGGVGWLCDLVLIKWPCQVRFLWFNSFTSQISLMAHNML